MKSDKPKIAIIGAGAAGLMAAEVLSAYPVAVQVFEQKPTAARKILMAGKTGLNISHSEDKAVFVKRYMPSDWLAAFVQDFGANEIVAWMNGLGIDSYVGSTGRIFPVQMKASKLVRAWLQRLQSRGVQFYYRHRCTAMNERSLCFEQLNNQNQVIDQFDESFDAVILACGGGSYPSLGSDGAWQAWLPDELLTPLYASNVGVLVGWSPYMVAIFGQPLKRVKITVGDTSEQGDVIISHYGLESGLIYKLNAVMRQASDTDGFGLQMDLLPDKTADEIGHILSKSKKQSLNTSLKKAGLDAAKIAILRECTPKSDWQNPQTMAKHIKSLAVHCTGFRPMAEAISTGGGVKRTAVDASLQLRHQAGVFCAGEMLDWDAPTGGYLLTGCFATGKAAAMGVLAFLNLSD
ncbi:TIGR03862 family flavoprotein [Moraxella marmotae]|uniref:TIGR03862 family flavoprotein n=1 Tax=Moraxella marmotae TaxID=3344520 RepID=UPI0035F3BEDC